MGTVPQRGDPVFDRALRGEAAPGVDRPQFRVLFCAAIQLMLAGMLVSVSSVAALADKRVALVIGNSAYQNVRRLDNPRNDAKLMADTLRAEGFSLVGGGAQLDLDKSAIDTAVQSFGQQVQGADVALFYYAGHGVQVSGANYLVPVNANPTREADVDFQMVDVNLVLRQMQDPGKRLNVVILDACRNNPFGGRGLGRATDGGLAQMRAPAGTLISYATQPGNVALDGVDGNSPYTAALAQTLRRPGLGIFEAFNEVGLAVQRSTGGAQQPWVSSSPIEGSFYFGGAPASVSSPSVAAPPAQPDPAGQAWAAVKDTASPAVLEAFVRRFGDSFYADIARARLAELKASQAAMTLPRVTAPPPAAPLPPATQARTYTCTVADPTGTPLNIRDNPQGNILSNISNGNRVRSLAVRNDYKGSSWSHIADRSGNVLGWVITRFLNCSAIPD